MLPPDFELYLVATLLMCVSPGPNVLLMISLGLRHGSSAVLRGVLGIVTASLIFLAVSALGVVAALVASPRLFGLIRYAGAAYLVYVGIRLLLAAATSPASTAASLAGAPVESKAPDLAAPTPRPEARHGAWWQGFVTHISNPKAVVFWSAILPPFVAMERAVAPQIVVLGLTGIAIDAAVLTAYGLFAAGARRAVSGPRLHRWLDGVAGVFFVGVGGWLLAAQP